MPKLSMQPLTTDLSTEELFAKFIVFKKIRNLAQDTIDYYEKCFEFFSEYYPTSLPCSGITKDVCLGYIQHLQQTRSHLKDTTINTYLRGVRALLYYGMELGYLSRFKLELIKANKELKETYTDEELALLLKKPDIKQCGFAEYRDWVMVNYFLATGNRLLTVMNLKIGDIDFEDGMIALTRTKNRKAQLVPLSQTMLRILPEYLQYRQGNSEDYLFSNIFGKQFSKGGLQTAIQTYNKNRGVAKTSVHLFRHTFAKKWILSGGDIFRLQKLLGHSSLEIVKEYVNIFGADLKAQYNIFNPLETVYRSQNLEAKKAIGMQKTQ